MQNMVVICFAFRLANLVQNDGSYSNLFCSMAYFSSDNCNCKRLVCRSIVLTELKQTSLNSYTLSCYLNRSGDQRLVAMTAVLNKMPTENKKNLGLVLSTRMSQFM